MSLRTKEIAPPSRRADLVGAARTLFADKGYHETTVEDITRAAGVAKGTFYLYFDEKRQIFLAIIRDLLDVIKSIGQTIGHGSPTEHPLAFFERAEQAALKLLEIFLENRPLARLAYRESMGMDPALDDMLRSFYREVAEIEARNIRIAQQLGLLRDCSPMLTAYAHIGMIERVVLTLLDDPPDFPPPADVVREVMQLAFEGLRAPGQPSPYEHLPLPTLSVQASS
jgi:AcrR family transcriptional regulator